MMGHPSGWTSRPWVGLASGTLLSSVTGMAGWLALCAADRAIAYHPLLGVAELGVAIAALALAVQSADHALVLAARLLLDWRASRS